MIGVPSRCSLPVLVALALAGCGGAPPPPAEPELPSGTVRLTPQQLQAGQVQVDTARADLVALPLLVPATVVVPDPASMRVGSIVDGYVYDIAVIPGDRVAQGADLIHIHSHELTTAYRDLSTAKAEMDFAQAAFDRSSRLLQAEAVSREEVERRRMAVDQAKAELWRAEEMVRHLSPDDDGDVRVLAPKAGRIFAVHVKVGDAVTAGAPLVEMGDDRTLWLKGYLPENASATFKVGTVVPVRVDALPGQELLARIVQVGGMVDSLRRALDVRAELTQVPPGVRPGMFASMVLPASDPAERVVLPADAVQRMAEGEVVFVADQPGLFHARRVTSTPLGANRVAVEGITPGVLVVKHGAYAVRAQLEARNLPPEAP